MTVFFQKIFCILTKILILIPLNTPIFLKYILQNNILYDKTNFLIPVSII